MLPISHRLRRLALDTEGATMVEYALLVALIAVVVIVAVKSIGTSANGVLQNAADNISGS
jgi:pilus assembly protein Flp/PilA